MAKQLLSRRRNADLKFARLTSGNDNPRILRRGLSFLRLLTEAATIVSRTLIIALGEPLAAINALIVIGFAYRWITPSSQFHSSIVVCE
jgi:hypothetical protein